MVLTQSQRDLIVGTLLGDGNLQTLNGNTWRYRAIHKAAHEPYIFHKYNILKEYCNTEPKYSSFLDPRTKSLYSRFTFQTLVINDLRYYGKLFYEQDDNLLWKKKVPKNIASLLTAQGLAYWYMDDGALKWRGKSNAVRLCTDSFSSSEVMLLKKVLEEKFTLKVSIQKKDNIQRLSILEESYSTLKGLILPYLIPSMYYKFPDGQKGIYDGQDISNDIVNRLDIPKDENPFS